MRPERLTRVRTCGAGHHRPVPSPSQLRGRLSAKKSVKSQGLGDRVPYSKATFLSKKTVDKRVGSPRPQPSPLAGLEARHQGRARVRESSRHDGNPETVLVAFWGEELPPLSSDR